MAGSTAEGRRGGGGGGGEGGMEEEEEKLESDAKCRRCF